MRRRKRGETGAILIAFALLLFVLLGFAALGTEVGRWFVVRAELSKTVDAAALAAAKNMSSPFVTPSTLAAEFCAENFPAGYLGTPGSGPGVAAFDIQVIGNDKVQVDGHASAVAILSRLFGVNLVPVVSRGVAQMTNVEIMLVLDRSGSMQGSPIADLQIAAITFVSLFTATQDRDKMGLISFATSVNVVRPMGTNYVAPMMAAINGMMAVGATNPEDALAQSIGPQGFTDQTGVPSDSRVQQFLIFFSDGRPTAYRGTFRNKNNVYDAVGCVTGNCDPGDGGMAYDRLGDPSREEVWLLNDFSVVVTGDGVYPNSKCGSGVVTTRWYDIPDSSCNIPWQTTLHDYVCNLASSSALFHAQQLKDRHITIYAIGLGSHVNHGFMESLASNPSLVYYAPTPDQLQAIFQKVAQEIKLRLVQ